MHRLLDDLIAAAHDRLGGPLPALPTRLDDLSERWWGLPPRLRVGMIAFLCALLAMFPLVRTARSAWGPPVDVLVAAADLRAGVPIGGDMVVHTRRPAALVPADALTDAGGILTVPVVSGTVLTARHRAESLPALLRAGEVAIPVPTDLQPDVSPGVDVDLLSAGIDGTGRTIAASARVLRIDGAWLWVAVPEDVAADAAAAAVDQRLILAVRRDGSTTGDR